MGNLIIPSWINATAPKEEKILKALEMQIVAKCKKDILGKLDAAAFKINIGIGHVYVINPETKEFADDALNCIKKEVALAQDLHDIEHSISPANYDTTYSNYQEIIKCSPSHKHKFDEMLSIVNCAKLEMPGEREKQELRQKIVSPENQDKLLINCSKREINSPEVEKEKEKQKELSGLFEQSPDPIVEKEKLIKFAARH